MYYQAESAVWSHEWQILTGWKVNGCAIVLYQSKSEKSSWLWTRQIGRAHIYWLVCLIKLTAQSELQPGFASMTGFFVNLHSDHFAGRGGGGHLYDWHLTCKVFEFEWIGSVLLPANKASVCTHCLRGIGTSIYCWLSVTHENWRHKTRRQLVSSVLYEI